MKNRVLLDVDLAVGDASCRSGVSLHGHTRHSIENLGFLGNYLNESALLRRWITCQTERGRRRTGIGLDLQRAHWTPPLCEREAFHLESRQIESLGLNPLVSLSDHDTIEASVVLRQLPESCKAPISTEWTIPFGRAVFHIGVHNLPAVMASSIMATLQNASTAAHEPAILDTLQELSRIPDVLLVFNHPLWNLNGIPAAAFNSDLNRFLRSANGALHAFELNGMRSYHENRDSMKLASAWDQVLISGGDRHGCEPNSALNLTAATEFSGFVDEIRNGKQSTILLMPQYQQPLSWRIYKSFIHVIEHYPANPEGRRRWDERIFHPDRNGELVPVANLWHLGPPGFLKKIFACAILSAHLPVPRVLSGWSREQREAFNRDTREWLGQQGPGGLVPTSHLSRIDAGCAPGSQ